MFVIHAYTRIHEYEHVIFNKIKWNQKGIYDAGIDKTHIINVHDQRLLVYKLKKENKGANDAGIRQIHMYACKWIHTNIMQNKKLKTIKKIKAIQVLDHDRIVQLLLMETLRLSTCIRTHN